VSLFPGYRGEALRRHISDTVWRIRMRLARVVAARRYGGERQRVSDYWAAKAQERASVAERLWTDSSIVQRRYIHPTISGTPDKNWFLWVKETFFSEPVAQALSLGCGDGCLERDGALLNVFERCDAYDISEGAVSLARQKADEAGIGARITYRVVDINKIELPKEHYDAVFCAMSLHHIEKLEYVLGEIRGSLKSGGLLLTNEYVGPNRFQWTDEQLRIANDLLRLLPERYRRDPVTHRIKTVIPRQTVKHMIAGDPSEAVKSQDIVPLIERFFTIVRRIDYGGTILNLLLEDVILNFDEQRPEDMAILDLILYCERLLLQKGVLESDFTVIVAANDRDVLKSASSAAPRLRGERRIEVG
jgi:ubiquinone/menaquinone biosynthesis C-methylase UbiE